MTVGTGTKGSSRCSTTDTGGMLALASNLATESSTALSLTEARATGRGRRGWRRSGRCDGGPRRRGGRRWTTCDGLARTALTTTLVAVGSHLGIACR